MKSDPGRSVVNSSTRPVGSPSGAPGPSLGAGGSATCDAAIAPVPMASVPILPAAAPFRNPRRPTRSLSFSEFAMARAYIRFPLLSLRKLVSRFPTEPRACLELDRLYNRAYREGQLRTEVARTIPFLVGTSSVVGDV